MTTRFFLDGDQVEILDGPEEFYKALLEESQKAKRRVLISSLYLGTGDLEKKLVNSWTDAIRRSADGFRMKVLLDANRGTRGGETSSRTMLLPLLHESQTSDREVRVSFFHSPKLRGILRKLLPQRYNEVVSTQHMKIYAFDDTVILSGANLSHDYFVRRVDRYYLIRGAHHLVDYYEGLMDVMAELSFRLTPEGDLVFECQSGEGAGVSLHPYKGNKEALSQHARHLLTNFLNSHYLMATSRAWKGDTTIIPLLQMPPFEVQEDEEATSAFLRNCESESRVDVASGYFNLFPTYRECILESTHCEVNVVAAAPISNGFHGATGSASYIPFIYTELMKRFLQHIDTHPDEKSRISLWEYSRPEWVFHAKGLWYTPASQHHPGLSQNGPTVTFVGSSNFGYRSLTRDLENQAIIQTDNLDLRRRMAKERDSMFQRASKLTLADFDTRHVPAIVRLLLPWVRKFV